MTGGPDRDDYLVAEMLRHAELIATVVRRGRSNLETDRVSRYALEHAIELFSEAGEKVSRGYRSKVPQIPWAELRGLRSEVAHPYDAAMDRPATDRLWRFARDELPRYALQLRRRPPARAPPKE